MTNELIFYTQIVSIISFISALFYLYRVLVKQKDATIELLKEKNSFLHDQLSVLSETTPDKLILKLSQRINILEDELERLGEDKNSDKITIRNKEKELKDTKNSFNKLKKQYQEFKELASEYFCPHCNSPMVVHEFHTVPHEMGDIDHEYIEFECGYSESDGVKGRSCNFSKSN